MTAETIPIETHETHSDRLMRHAYRELDRGDRLQASEKAWGAVAHGIKAVAARRGWKCETDRDASAIISRLADEAGDDRLRLLFISATYIYRYYWIDAVPLDEIRHCLEYAEELLETLKGV